MNTESFISQLVKECIKSLYSIEVSASEIQLQATKKDFEGDITLVVFPLLKLSKKSPEQTAEEIANQLLIITDKIEKYNVVKGFLNLKLSRHFWLNVLNDISQQSDFGQHPSSGKTIMVEYSSPNTNKPLHLGHIRNNLLGWSVSKLLEANGHKVLKVNLVNDRGIHICKSMLAWKMNGNGETPQSSELKGDHLVGKYYVEYNNLIKNDSDKTIENATQKMLQDWESGDLETISLWKMMNGWVYEGFNQTYKRLGIEFDKIYYESDTYILGKELVSIGLKRGVFTKKDDGSVWCDLTSDGLDEKLLLRADGTSVYMTQDLGTAHQRYLETPFDELIYVVGNEQNYHFQVLKLILKKLGFTWSDSIYHLSYGMVELPEGKMKSREGTVVDADDLIQNMVDTARDSSIESGKLENLEDDERNELYETIGLGALKYFILKVDPRKTMLFDPRESIDFNGNTGPFIQYTHARIKSILKRANAEGFVSKLGNDNLLPKEIELIKLMNQLPDKISEAGKDHSPALIANYIYDLAKEFNQYYHETSILKEGNDTLKSQRLLIIENIAKVLIKSATILGMKLPERM